MTRRQLTPAQAQAISARNLKPHTWQTAVDSGISYDDLVGIHDQWRHTFPGDHGAAFNVVAERDIPWLIAHGIDPLTGLERGIEDLHFLALNVDITDNVDNGQLTVAQAMDAIRLRINGTAAYALVHCGIDLAALPTTSGQRTWTNIAAMVQLLDITTADLVTLLTHVPADTVIRGYMNLALQRDDSSSIRTTACILGAHHGAVTEECIAIARAADGQPWKDTLLMLSAAGNRPEEALKLAQALERPSIHIPTASSRDSRIGREGP